MKHKHKFEKIEDVLHCVICNKISILNKKPPKKNGCFGKPHQIISNLTEAKRLRKRQKNETRNIGDVAVS